MQTLVFTYNPPESVSWDDQRRVGRWERVAEWHEYAARLHREGKLTHAWGSHSLVDAAAANPRQHVLVCVYTTADFDEFDRLRDDDPLLEQSEFVTVPLVDLDTQLAADTQRWQDLHDRVLREDAVSRRVYAEHKAVTKSTPPSFVGKYPKAAPDNPGTDFDAGPRAPLTVMLYGVNPDEYVDTWTDMAKLLHCQKLLWWHDYMAMLHAQRKVSHIWGTADFTSALETTPKTGGTVAVYESADYEEFDGLYRHDPVRSKRLFQSVVLRPIAEQRASDLRRLELARKRASSTFV
jgi:hypothetical protein